MSTSDLPDRIQITEEGPREGFQIEPGPIETADKLRFIQSLAETGLSAIQVCSLVSPRRVPGWADADVLLSRLQRVPGVQYTALWFNEQGIRRALDHADTLTLKGSIHTVASEAFCQNNLRRTRAENHQAMLEQTRAHQSAGIPVSKLSVMAAFGCNFSADVPVAQAVAAVRDGLQIAAECGADIQEIALADTMGWAHPAHVHRLVSEVRTAWPEKAIRLHLHDTRGLGIANAHAGLCCGVDRFDSAAGGLGGCPFAARIESAGNRPANDRMPPGNIATEELVLLAHESGIETGVDLDALLESARLAEAIVGHPLPSAALRGGSFSRYRAPATVR